MKVTQLESMLRHDGTILKQPPYDNFIQSI